MRALPRLLETYEEARLLLEAKGWGMAKGAEHLSGMKELARFHISQAKLSKKTTPGSKFAVEPEIAAAVEGMETRVGFERQTEIITRGLLALHGDPPIVDVERLATELREHLPAGELALKLVEALEEKSGQRLTRISRKLAERSAGELTPKLVEAVEALEEKANQRALSFAQQLAEKSASELAPKVVEAVEALEEKASQRALSVSQQLAEKLGRVSWKKTAITAVPGALVGCLALLLAPLLPDHSNAAAQPGPPVLIVSGPGEDCSQVWLRFERESVLAALAWGEKMPAEQYVPRFTLPGQGVAPCDAEGGEVAIYGNCWARLADVKPPCGRRTFRHEDSCYRPVAPALKKPIEPAH